MAEKIAAMPRLGLALAKKAVNQAEDAMVLQVVLLVLPPILLGIFSLPLGRSDPRALAAFSMIGIYVLNAVMDCTASGGGTPWRLFFIIAGWSAALLNAPTPEVAVETVWLWPRKQVGFRRVMV